MDFSLEPTAEAQNHGFDRSLNALKSGRPYVYAKLNHGFWERLCIIEAAGYDLDQLHNLDTAEIDRKTGANGAAFAEDGFLAELLELLARFPSPERSVDFCASLNAWPMCWEIEGTPFYPKAKCLAQIDKFVPKGHRNHASSIGMTGYEFKLALIQGRFSEFAKELASRPTVQVGNRNLTRFNEFIGSRDSRQVVIDPGRARWQRQETLAELLALLDSDTGRKCVIMQAGGSFATWLTAKLLEHRDDLQIFDLGNAMTIANPAILMRQNWAKVYQRNIETEAEKIHPGWFTGADFGALPVSSPFNGRDPKLTRLADDNGVAGAISSAPILTLISRKEPASFVENKVPDWDRVRAFCELSANANHHANGGPVSMLLESAVAKLINLGAERRVLACNSGTSALFLGAALAAIRLNLKSPRWVASSFGFYSSRIGPLGNAQLIDCEENGAFSLDRLQALPEDSWDGVILTNIFAQQANWTDVRTYCQAHGKAFVVDNATGLLDRAANADKHSDIEAISAHHTKPWGYGEGGFLILPEDALEMARSLANFGVHLGAENRGHAQNAKLSDIAAAAILDRLERLAYWGTLYQMQERRMRSIMSNLDLPLTPLPGQNSARSPRAHLPLLATRTIPVSVLGNETLVLRKYYPPLGESAPNAQALYDRILCVSCNPELRLVSTETIAATIQGILENQ